MEIENEFEVAAPVDDVWAYLLDVEKVVPCMPGAELTETIDEENYKGKVTVKVGPVTLTYAGKVTMAEKDDQDHRVVLKASGMEQRGKGAAQATVTSTLVQSDGGTRVEITQDLRISGQAAQVSRGMMQDVATKLTKQFADCLRANIGAEGNAAPGETRQQVRAEPIKGLRLGMSALGRAIKRFLARLFGRGPS